MPAKTQGLQEENGEAESRKVEAEIKKQIQ